MSNFAICNLLLLTLVFGCVRVEEKSHESTSKRPNVLMIVVDDMNGYGLKDQYPLVQIPYLDKLRSESVNFVNAACNTPICNPSRSSFFSGLYPHSTGAYVNGSDGWNRSPILQQIRSLPEHFKDNGYTTWGRGKIFHNPMDSLREHQMWDNRPIYKGGFGPFPEKEYWFGGNRFNSIKAWEEADTDFPDVVNADAAINFLKKEHQQPFFLYYGLWRPHSPYTAPKRFFELYQEKDIVLPEGYLEGDLDDVPPLGRLLVDSLKKYQNKPIEFERLWRKFLMAYCANTSFTDWNVGRVIEALDQSPHSKNTIVVFFSDNGFHFGEKLRHGKATLWEASDYVPFLVRMPDKKGAISKATISLVDVYPTLVDYCNITAPTHSLDGESFAPQLSDPQANWSRPSLTTYGIQYASVRNEQYRFLQYPDGSRELYDHYMDPWEFNNLAGREELQSIMEELSVVIPKAWAPSTGGRLEVRRNYDLVLRPRSQWDIYDD